MTKKKQEKIAKAIKSVVSEMMERVMDRVLITDPFIKEKHHSSKPLYAALVPDEIFKYKTVGITAGASTPDWMIDRIEAELMKEAQLLG